MKRARRLAGLPVFLLFVFSGLYFAGGAHGAIDAFEFDNPAMEARFKRLTEELRCLVCQNQSLADSNADLALDLRRQVYNMVKAGSSDQEITEYMVARYGDFVLYRPPLQSNTLVLWFAPFVIGAIALMVLMIIVRRRKAAIAREGRLSADEQARLRQMLEGDDEQT